ncbi:hypothetical protein L596_020222 [Steinernema carpocapsae]|uniref:Uncharacterized protein n=1 Tax=Steinernema carpocapsae TaxID=34508 RepID=A0A4U5MSW4_STECR|nr:hypothetical protein L596_020222 [Steinernema carpocapsae]
MLIKLVRGVRNPTGVVGESLRFGGVRSERLAMVGEGKIGLGFPWVETCGDEVLPFAYLFMENAKFVGSCTYFYDLAEKKRVHLYGHDVFGPITQAAHPFEGLKCDRRTLLAASSCPDYFDEYDSPLRDVIQCQLFPHEKTKNASKYAVSNVFKKVPEATLDKAFKSAYDKLTYPCLNGSMRLSDFLEGSVGLMRVSAPNLRACYVNLALDSNGDLILTAGPVVEEIEGIFQFYSEHFISQLLTNGIAIMVDPDTTSSTLICSYLSDYRLCVYPSRIGMFVELLLSFHYNKHLHVNRTKKWSQETCHDVQGGSKFFRVCCGGESVHDVRYHEMPFTWPVK